VGPGLSRPEPRPGWPLPHGTVWWSPRTGAHTVWGAIRDVWLARHQEFGPLGYPTTDEYAVPGGVAQRFQHGTLTYSFRTGRVR
jgi:uncharacterized protein with LGFP repeats